MRKLSKKQKKYLDELYKKFEIGDTYDLTPEQYEHINDMNCFENMDWEIDRYLMDKKIEKGSTRSEWYYNGYN
jgi:hypothetical protein